MTDVPYGMRARLQPWRSYAEIGWTWAQVVSAWAIMGWAGRWWVYPFAIVFIAARQYALAVLLHEGQHRLLHPRRQINDGIARWLLAAPLGADFDASRISHLLHHRYLGNPALDPDYPLYAKGRWQREPAAARSKKWIGSVICAHAALVASLALTIGIWAYCLLWLLPLALAGILDRLRIKAEHSPDGRVWSHKSNPVERFFLSPFHMEHHAEHHIAPHVPHYRLSAKRRELGSAIPIGEWLRGTYWGTLCR